MSVARLMLAAMLLLLPRLASAEVVVMRCDVPWGHSGQVMHRVIELDRAARQVRDGSLTWHAGERHYALHDIAAFVQAGPEAWEWGDANTDTGAEANRFRLDLRRGTYDHSAGGLPLLHGTCTLAGPGV